MIRDDFRRQGQKKALHDLESLDGGPDGDGTISKYNNFKKVLAWRKTPADLGPGDGPGSAGVFRVRGR